MHSAFRHDRLRGVWLALFVLFIPYFHPIAEAMAAGKPFAAEICTAFGQTSRDVIPAQADDCPMCIGGTFAPGLGADPAINPADLQPVFLTLAPADFPSPLTRVDVAQKDWLMPPGRAPPSAF
jgi:hypothetical protein